MPEYRSPEEDRATAEHQAQVQAVIDQARRDATSVHLAMELEEPPEVVDMWVDKLWNGLRRNLSDDRPDRAGLRQEDRLAAIVLLIQDQALDDARALLRGASEA